MATGSAGETECDLCGAEINGRAFWRDRIGGVFCSRYHRDKSTRMVRELREACEDNPENFRVPPIAKP